MSHIKRIELLASHAQAGKEYMQNKKQEEKPGNITTATWLGQVLLLPESKECVIDCIHVRRSCSTAVMIMSPRDFLIWQIPAQIPYLALLVRHSQTESCICRIGRLESADQLHNRCLQQSGLCAIFFIILDIEMKCLHLRAHSAMAIRQIICMNLLHGHQAPN